MKSPAATPKLYWLDRKWFEVDLSQQDAEAFCRRLARSHYENFTVVSFLLPRHLRQHFANVYAYCRISDDLADEVPDPDLSLRRLDEWQAHLDRCYQGDTVHPVFMALQSTIRAYQIPKEPFARLLVAFRQDQRKKRYRDWDELIDYCTHSANPVGHLVLYLCGYRDHQRQELSDATCTALQLTNFWQDVRRDYGKGRIYIPQDIFQEHGYTEDMLSRFEFNPAWARLMQDLVGRTRELFDHGRLLLDLVRGRSRFDIALFSLGGMEILRAIEKQGYDTIHRRPKLSRRKELALLGRAFLSEIGI